MESQPPKVQSQPPKMESQPPKMEKYFLTFIGYFFCTLLEKYFLNLEKNDAPAWYRPSSFFSRGAATPLNPPLDRRTFQYLLGPDEYGRAGYGWGYTDRPSARQSRSWCPLVCTKCNSDSETEPIPVLLPPPPRGGAKNFPQKRNETPPPLDFFFEIWYTRIFPEKKFFASKKKTFPKKKVSLSPI